MHVVLLRIRNRSVYSNFLNMVTQKNNSTHQFVYVQCSKCFTLHPLAHLFIPTPSRLLWEALSHAAVTARRPFVRIITTAYSQVLIYTNEWAVATFVETNCQSFETAAPPTLPPSLPPSTSPSLPFSPSLPLSPPLPVSPSLHLSLSLSFSLPLSPSPPLPLFPSSPLPLFPSLPLSLSPSLPPSLLPSLLTCHQETIIPAFAFACDPQTFDLSNSQMYDQMHA